ncbi:MAG TPA: hypothetical protein VEG29_07655 [Candidatus Binatia bacterium]|nr:hypothetical protein [Candidatus Binatia bacterium]
MQYQAELQLRLAKELRFDQARAAAAARLAARPAPRAARRPIRRALGDRIIAIGQRIAADPSLRPARSR